MRVVLGNNSALEGYRDPLSDDPEKVRYRSLSGERETEMVFREGIALMDAAHDVLVTIPMHMVENPAWVECDDSTLLSMISEHFGNIPKKRPMLWGASAADKAASEARKKDKGN